MIFKVFDGQNRFLQYLSLCVKEALYDAVLPEMSKVEKHLRLPKNYAFMVYRAEYDIQTIISITNNGGIFRNDIFPFSLKELLSYKQKEEIARKKLAQKAKLNTYMYGDAYLDGYAYQDMLTTSNTRRFNVIDRLAEDIALEIDREILGELEQTANNAPRPHQPVRPSLPYQGIARRALATPPVPLRTGIDYMATTRRSLIVDQLPQQEYQITFNHNAVPDDAQHIHATYDGGILINDGYHLQ